MSSSSFSECLNSLPLDVSEYVHLPQSVVPLLLKRLFQSSPESLLYLLSPQDDRDFLIEFFQSQNIPVFFLPFYDLLPYEDGIPNPQVRFSRLKGLFAISEETRGIYLVPLKTFLFRVPTLSSLCQELSSSIRIGDEFHRETWIEKLVSWQYTRVQSIEETAQFTLRGELLEIWDPIVDKIIRIHLSYDTVEKILIHEPKDLSQSKPLQEVLLHSCQEFLYTPTRHQLFVDSLKLEKTPNQIEAFSYSVGLSQSVHLSPFFYKTPLLHLWQEGNLPVRLVVSNLLESEGQEKRYLREVKELFSSSFNHSKMMISPSTYYSSLSTLLKDFSPITFFSPFTPLEHSGEIEHSFVTVSDFLIATPSYQGKIELFANLLESYPDFQTSILASSDEAKEKLETIFPNIPIFIDPLIRKGIIDLVNRRIFITEQDLFGKFSSLKKKTDFLKDSSPIEHFSELSKGDFIVHIHHGIGIYQGIEKMSIMGMQKDYIKIAYADEEVLYTPIEQIFLVHKYMGSTNPTINHLGGKKWDQKKARILKALEEMSEELVLLYETRKKIPGFAFPPDTPFQEIFEKEFPYTPTDGQIQATEDIKKDMESPLVMDRLVCGDVGYGKTEVAFRAAFKAVSAGKQVAFLAPTTLLVEQHYHTMLGRFSQFPIRIALLSRTLSAKEQKQVLENLQNGSIDIIVGTHVLFGQKVRFKDLGLLIIDEEQRFGVKHKEKIKEDNPRVDTIVLSATPIPRTLHMGLSSFRDMSLITTPPTTRLPIKTYVTPFNEETLASAVRRELERGGQVFMIHNRIQTIEFFASFIQKLIPEARIAIGHAQLNSTEMEQVFIDFIAHKTDILISTTIVENGIDIANANTIIIDKPELLGLGELYQLRGRVGRGQRQGYAYLFYDPITGLTLATQQRLQTIEEHTSLGSGFQIAMRDLEIRGAGNLLGKAQSGLFNDVGMTLYSQILQKVVHKIKGQENENVEPLMDLPFDGQIPETYISEDKERFQFYKILMQASTEEQMADIEVNSIQAYGPIPPSMKNLFKVSRIKILAKLMAIKEIRYQPHGYELEFISKPDINTAILIPHIEKAQAKILTPTTLWIEKNLFAEDLLEDLLIFLQKLKK